MTPGAPTVNAHAVRHPGGLPEVKPLFTVKEAVEILRIGRSKLYEEMHLGRLRAIKVGRATRIPAEFLAEYRSLLIAEGEEALA